MNSYAARIAFVPHAILVEILDTAGEDDAIQNRENVEFSNALFCRVLFHDFVRESHPFE